MKLERIHCQDFYVSRLTPSGIPSPDGLTGLIMYVHGGPGFHSAYFEQAIQEIKAYISAPWGWICYDQRGCGRSPEGGFEPSHHQNIEDLASLIRDLKDREVEPLRALLGHSYGGWLVHQTLAKYPDLDLPAIVLATAPDMRTARNRSVALDMLELRMDAPNEYAELLEEFGEVAEPLWTFQKLIRDKNLPLPRRSFFTWGNLEVKKWYEQLKERVGVKENWELTRRISNAADFKLLTTRISASDLNDRLLWICGVHDLLMGYDQYLPGEKLEITAFLKSGHYLHFEEPDRFLAELNGFMKRHLK